MDNNELFICRCHNTEHQLIFSYFDDEDNSDIYVSVHLSPERNIFKRIWVAIKYIFGHRSRYGHFDEFVFNPSDANRLQAVVNRLKQAK